tara:strand:+ start:327 stop:635 length:309 start_codon:yes stop_codon:yes gene_type:complete
MKLELSRLALEDLRGIREYTRSTWGREQEELYLDALWQKLEDIREDSKRWRFRHDLFPNCQIATQGKHVILFRIEKETTLQVARILHSAMDLGRHVDPGNET